MLLFASDLAGASTVSSFLAELLVISAVALGCKYLRLPYTIALVAAGLLLGLARPVFELKVQLTPELLFVVLLPALLFEAAIHLSLDRVRKNLRAILLLAVPGLLITTAFVGFALHWLLGISLGASLIFGSLISATDPIAVLALFKELKAPKDLAVIVEGESLLNDGAAVVVFNLLLAASAGREFHLLKGVLDFSLEAGGGLLVGAALAWLVWKVHEGIDDPLIEMTLSTILAYGSYLVAQELHVSGVMAVIAAGLLYGNFAMGQSMSANTRLTLGSSWDYLGFLCNSLVFLLIGTQVNLWHLASRAGLVVIAFLVVLLGRLLAVLLLSPWTRLKLAWNAVVIWAGLRGSIAMALAMALQIPEREDILLLTFGCVLLSVFAQGLSVKRLLNFLGMGERDPDVQRFESAMAELMAQQKALAVLRTQHSQHRLGAQLFQELLQPLQERIGELQRRLDELSSLSCVRELQSRQVLEAMRTARRWGLREALVRQHLDERDYLELRERLACVESPEC
ncbi:MAG: Na+/H+ antiporter [Vulcanimicrobiota bacterium]